MDKVTQVVRKCVVLARGLGTRMQKKADVDIGVEENKIAHTGLKGMVPFRGRPFLDYSIQNMLDAGIRDVCLVVGPEHDLLTEYYRRVADRVPWLKISFAVQEKALGTSDAVYASKDYVGDEPFIVLNSDNLYSAHAIALLRSQHKQCCYVAGFDKDAMIRESNIEEERINHFAVVEVDNEWNLIRIHEKPEDPNTYGIDGRVIINMNLLRFTPAVFRACEKTAPDPVRGEYEITSTIQILVDEGRVPVKVVYVNEGVLDLTYKRDIVALRKILYSRRLDF